MPWRLPTTQGFRVKMCSPASLGFLDNQIVNAFAAHSFPTSFGSAFAVSGTFTNGGGIGALTVSLAVPGADFTVSFCNSNSDCPGGWWVQLGADELVARADDAELALTSVPSLCAPQGTPFVRS